MSVQFGFDFSEDDPDPSPQTYRLAPKRLFLADMELDLTVVAVADCDGVPPGDAYGRVSLLERTDQGDEVHEHILQWLQEYPFTPTARELLDRELEGMR